MGLIEDGNVPTVDSNLKIGLKCTCNACGKILSWQFCRC